MNPWTTGQEDQGCYLPTKAEIEDHKTAIRIANTIKFLMGLPLKEKLKELENNGRSNGK